MAPDQTDRVAPPQQTDRLLLAVREDGAVVWSSDGTPFAQQLPCYHRDKIIYLSIYLSLPQLKVSLQTTYSNRLKRAKCSHGHGSLLSHRPLWLDCIVFWCRAFASTPSHG